MQNRYVESPCLPQHIATSCRQISSNAQNYTTVSQKIMPCKAPTEYPKPIYEPLNCPCPPCPAPYPTWQPCPCGSSTGCQPTCPCQPSKPPCPCPCPPINPCPCTCTNPTAQNAHVGTSGATLLVGGPTGVIPIDQFISHSGSDICQVNPVKLKGPHTYLVEWSGAIDPIDTVATAKMELLLDGVPVTGSSNYTDITASVDGAVALSGGAIVTVPAGCHTLELAYTTGNSGAEVANVNMRIVELS